MTWADGTWIPPVAEWSTTAVSSADDSSTASTRACTSPSSHARSAGAAPDATLFPTEDKAEGVAIVTQWDARALMLPDDSVDLIVTSPPYFALRSYQDGGDTLDGQIGAESSPKEFVAALVDCTREWLRVLKPTGSLFVNLGDKYCSDNRGSGVDKKRGAAKHAPAGRQGYVGEGYFRPKSLMGLPWRYALECVDTLGLILRAEIIWDKPNCLPEPVGDRVVRRHEQWFHFVQEGKHYGDTDPIREPRAGTNNRDYVRESHSSGDLTSHRSLSRDVALFNPLGRRPGSVWRVPSEPFKAPAELGVEHYAAFPSEFPRRIISAWCPPGGIVLDPFGGTGTVALAAQELGCVGISNDLSGDYCRLAQWRTTDPKQRDRMRRRIEENKR